MTFLQLYGEALTIELGSADTSSLFTTARRKKAINDAQTEFAKQTECFAKSTSLTMADGTQEYDLEAVIAADDYLALAKDGVEYVYTDADGNVQYASGDDFPRLDLDLLNKERVGWRNASSANLPSAYYFREQGGSVYFGLAEAPSIGAGASATVTLPYLALPPEMSSDSDEPFSDTAGSNPKRSLRPYHQALVHYAAALLEPARKGYAAEQRQRAIFAGFVADYLQRHRRRAGSRITVARNYRGEASSRLFGRNAYTDVRVRP